MRSNSAESAIGPVPGGGGVSLKASIWFWVNCFHERSFYFMNFCGFFSRSFFFLFGPFEPLYEVTAFCLTCSSQVGFEEGCKSIVGKINSNRDGLYLSHGLAILSNAFPSDWERSLRFFVYPTLFPSNNTVPLGRGRWAWILLSFWTQMTLKIYGMKLELLLCVSIHSIFFVIFTFSGSFQSTLDTEVLWNGIQDAIFAGRPGILPTLPCCVMMNTHLHSQYDILLLERVFNDRIHWNGLFMCHVHYQICVSIRVEEHQTKDPVQKRQQGFC